MKIFEKFRINKTLLPVKAHFFIFSAALSFVLPFRTVFAKQLGISATAVGVIFLAVPFLKILTNPLFGFIMDYFKRYRLTMAVILIIVAVSNVAMVLIPPKTADENEGFPMEKHFQFVVNYYCFQDASLQHHNQFEFRIYGKPFIHNTKDQRLMCKLMCKNNETIKNYVVEEKFQECAEHLNLELNVSIKIFAHSNKIRPSLMNGEIFLDPEQTNKVAKDNATHSSWPLHFFNNKSTLINTETEVSTESTFLSQNSSMHESSHRERNENEEPTKANMSHSFSTRIHATHSLPACPCETQFKCFNDHCKFLLNDMKEALNEKKFDSEEFRSVQFWGLFILIAISSVTFSSIIFLMDAICYETLGNEIQKFGEQRLWGTMGWGIGALAAGYVNEIYSTASTSIDYSLSFYLLAGFTVLDLIPVYKLEVKNIQYSSHICKDVGLLLFKVDMVVTILIAYAIGVLSGLIWNYQFWFMEEIGASQVLLGLSQTFECFLSELPCFFVSGWIIRKVGHINCNSITLFLFGLRYLCFTYMYNPWVTLPVSLISGPTFGLFYASMTMYGKSQAPPGTEATVQALLSMSYEGVGAATGSILGGIGFDKIGSRTTFLYAAIASFALLFINILWYLIDIKRRRSLRIQQKASYKSENQSAVFFYEHIVQ